MDLTSAGLLQFEGLLQQRNFQGDEVGMATQGTKVQTGAYLGQILCSFLRLCAFFTQGLDSSGQWYALKPQN